MDPPAPLASRADRIARALLADPWRTAAAVVAWATMVTVVTIVMAPWLRDTRTFGFHDWDVQTAHRELVRISLLRYHEFPGWDPYACGGFPAWGYVEAGTNLVSPFLPAYLALPMSLALRIEVAGMALLGAAGAYALASRFTASHAARALVAVLWAVNGRWGLQTAAGHTWHLAYAFMPWCFYFFERARQRDRRVLDLAGAGVAIAMLVYAGGIYPLPHTVLSLGVYAALLAILERSARPILVLAAAGLVGVGLAAPKLFPLLDGFRKAPRLIDSNETMDVGALVTMLTSRDQGFSSRPARVSPYGWHEWGIYVSTAGALTLLLAVVLVQGKREAALKGVGVLLVALGFGAFHPQAPWTLFHKMLPVFKSQHVPSRFLYPAILVLGLVAAAGIGRFITRRSGALPWLDVAAAILVLAIGVDVALVAQKPMAAAMWMVPPDRIPKDRPFHFEQEPPFQYKRRDWAGPMYLAMLGNTGVINCYGTPPFDRKGAQPVSAPGYRGEAYIDGPGKVRVAEWSPNRAVIEVEGAAPGALVVYNMNFDEGWRSDAGPVVAYKNAVATRLPFDDGGSPGKPGSAPKPPGTTRITFQYRPPYLGLGLLAFAATVGGLALLRRREREEAA